MKNLFKDSPQYKPALQKLNAMIHKLEEQGFEVITGLCCSSCSVNALDTHKQYMFYHRQDEDTLKETGTMYVAFGWGGDEINDDADMDTGRIICNVADESNIPFEWDESPYRRIKLVFTA